MKLTAILIILILATYLMISIGRNIIKAGEANQTTEQTIQQNAQKELNPPNP